MKVLLINGSPHEKGCTYTALSLIAKELNDAGVDTEILHVGGKPVGGCIGCGGCAAGRWWGFPAPAVPAATVRVRSFWPLPRPTGCRITRTKPSCPWRCSTMMPSTRCSGR